MGTFYKKNVSCIVYFEMSIYPGTYIHTKETTFFTHIINYALMNLFTKYEVVKNMTEKGQTITK